MNKHVASSKKRKKIFTRDILLNILPYVVLVFVSIFPLFALFHAGLPVTHDGKDHIARVANFYQNLQDGIIVPRWAENLNWGYGHPVLMFLYPFPSYFASFFHFLGLSFVDSVKWVFGVSFVASGLAMYVWVSQAVNKKAGFVAAILYLFAPYRFVDLYVRGAYGEHVAFIFLPLMMYFLYRISYNPSIGNALLGGISLAGLLLSHNAISLMFLPVFGLYALYLFMQVKQKKRFISITSIYIILGFALAAFFWIPALLEGKYTLRNIVTDKDYASRFVPFVDFLYGAWSFNGSALLSKQVGIIQWVLLIIAVPTTVFFFMHKNKYWQLTLGSLLIFSFSLFIMTSASKPIWDQIGILQNFQFPWRFLSLVVFITAFCGALVITAFPKKIATFLTIVICIAAIGVTIPYWKVMGYIAISDSSYTRAYEGTTDTGESAPIWSVRFMEKHPKAPLEIVEGTGMVVPLTRTTTSHTYKITANEKIRIRENTLYFPGWKVYVNNQETAPEFQDPKHRGLLTFYIDKGVHEVAIRFEDTKIRLVSNLITIFALGVIGFFCIMKVFTVWKHSR